MTPDHAPCAACGRMTSLAKLDGKPKDLTRFIAATVDQTQLSGLQLAADLGADFDRLECEACYGPGYAPL